ncbi:MAG: hypothetical protein ACYTFV_14240 [Planctomycetota bacterium]
MAFGWWWGSGDGQPPEVQAATLGRSVGPALSPTAEELHDETAPTPVRESVGEAQPEEPAAETPKPQEPQPARTWEPPDEETDQLAAWLEDLRSDDVAWNATDAASRLTHAIRRKSNRERLRPLAEPLLYSDDRQQRLLVTTLMLRLENRARSAGDGYVPHPLVEERALEWLAHPESLGYDCRGLTPKAIHARTFCVNQGYALHDRLAGKLRSGDEEVQFYAALLLGAQGVERYAPTIASILVPHLADNRIDEDALEAAFALKQLGSAVLPWLPTTAVDEQQAYLLEALRDEIHMPGSSSNNEGRWDISQSAPYGPVSYYRPKAYYLFSR